MLNPVHYVVVAALHDKFDFPPTVEFCWHYHHTTNISRTLLGNEMVDHSDEIGASPVGAALTTSSFLAEHLAAMIWANTTARRDEKHLSFLIWCDWCKKFEGNCYHLSYVSRMLASQFTGFWKQWDYNYQIVIIYDYNGVDIIKSS